MIRLLEQLDTEGKELIAITDRYILVFWWQDKSYVSWEYYQNKAGKYIFEVGHYLRVENNTKNSAIAAFSERIN